MNSWSIILELLPMESATKLKFGSIVGFLIGFASMVVHPDSSSTNPTANDISTAISGGMALLSAFYFFEHSLLEVKSDLKNLIYQDVPESTTTVITTPTEPVVPIETPAVPIA